MGSPKTVATTTTIGKKMFRQVKRCERKCLCSENGFLEKPTRAKTYKKGNNNNYWDQMLRQVKRCEKICLCSENWVGEEENILV